MSHSSLPAHDGQPQAAHYRSGVAARLAGLPVETLRVWERRYAISDTGRSARGQRLYSEAQVRRLRLMKQLVDQGHPIGALARLSLEQLSQLAIVPVPGNASQPPRVALVGTALARRLAPGGRELLALDIVARIPHLDGAGAAVAGSGAQLVLLEMSELDDGMVPAICALRAQSGVAVVVLYRFCASATIRQLRTQGCLVARAPADVAEIVLLCHSALPQLPQVPVQAQQAAPSPSPAPRRFDDQALAELAAASSSIYCECPRHLSEILLMLNSFERYSQQCAARDAADALLHEQLSHAAGSARVLLEEALERLARAEALPLPAGM
ncbi:MerR family transcriptional regulator [Janthinobacterium sp. RB2R34]|uniref:MerR family transcriptional regulator n=1 Tax=Janthinobacterium sp. RB2R34 TaxID=3424193 RepID=UPI003F275E8C